VLASRQPILAHDEPLRAASVLLPFFAPTEGAPPELWLVRRPDDMRMHGGQVALPGGKYEPEDTDLLSTALREAEEEIGLERRFVEPVGYLDLYLTTLGYRIVPTITRVKPGFQLRLNRDEVDDAFEVPLAFLMTPENHQRHSRPWNGMTRTFYAMPFGERYIWGATAGILRNLYERIYQG